MTVKFRSRKTQEETVIENVPYLEVYHGTPELACDRNIARVISTDIDGEKTFALDEFWMEVTDYD